MGSLNPYAALVQSANSGAYSSSFSQVENQDYDAPYQEGIYGKAWL